jgi:F0F1-type ATP synthase membrane subunit c/vacuolar-type H+-ATPase subunit K
MIGPLDIARAAIVLGAAIVAVLAGVPLVRAFLAVVDRTQSRAHDAGEPARDTTVTAGARRLGGGAWIGMLERLAVFACLMTGFPAGIAIVLGIKGLARYPELQSPDATTAQAFIMGTFCSVLWAAGCAGVAFWATGLL